MRIFEYGCGGSTLFFAKYGNEIISIEHDHEWYKKMSEYLNDNNINNVILKYFKPEREVDVEKLFLSHNEEYEGLSFRKYVNAIDDYPDKYFDIILIDGRARTACFIKSQKKVKDNGIIVWDNTERKRYRDGFLLGSKKFKKIELPGPTPYTKSFTITTIFKLA